ncbi:effector-binding domain-containing protein [Agreia bicolorata]|uniref:Effector-binding domain-containing protein n=1 Tax=Agreia bicolorata TaxID=110935 RepID=A0A1T4XHL6_9MICO|nr:GyrI-like domain-containing protein [Agreia bicolorata]SKA88967.1 effector-binding domain-containing protein [Agreia bicolorata]
MLMPIGRFARASRLSVKSLRNYDDSGLLRAAFVDPHSGYRYYRLEQLGAAAAIRSLRSLDLPLGQIAEILAGKGPEPTLTSHLALLEEQRDHIDRKLQDLRRLMIRKEFTMSETVTVKTLPAQVAAIYRCSTSQQSVFEDIPAGFGLVLRALESVGVDPIGAPFTVFYQTPDADALGDIALCIPIHDSVRPDAGLDISFFDEHVVAAITHHGPYEDMAESYATVSEWIHRYGHRIVGPTREIYLNSPEDVAPGELLTEIQFPIDPDNGDD